MDTSKHKTYKLTKTVINKDKVIKTKDMESNSNKFQTTEFWHEGRNFRTFNICVPETN